MSRVSHIPSTALSPELGAIYEKFASAYGPFRNQAAVFAHVPSALHHIMSMLMELKAQRNIEWRYIELAIVVTSKLNACHYCVAHHTRPLMVECNVAFLLERLQELDNKKRIAVSLPSNELRERIEVERVAVQRVGEK